jgi:hypothetical protein
LGRGRLPEEKPRGFDPLQYIAEYYATVEVTSTFYPPATALAWRQRDNSSS